MVVTDHLIQRLKPSGDLLAERAEYYEGAKSMYHGEVVPYESGARPVNPASAVDTEMYVALAQVRDGATLEKGIPRLQKAIAELRPWRPERYFELANAYRDIHEGGNALALYRKALATRP